MNSTKVPGTLACAYARVALQGRVTLAKMAENSPEVLTDATPHIALQEAVLTKKILATTVQ